MMAVEYKGIKPSLSKKKKKVRRKAEGVSIHQKNNP
jgi:hypothetical protein